MVWPYVRHRPVFIKAAEWIKLVLGIVASFNFLTLCWKEIWVYPKMRVLSCGALSQTLDKFHYSTLIWRSVVNIVRSTTITSLSQWACTFVYNTMGKAVDLTGLLGDKRRLGDKSPSGRSRGGAPVRGLGTKSPRSWSFFCETTHNICIKIQQTTVYWGDITMDVPPS